jgi:hypothetical protein
MTFKYDSYLQAFLKKILNRKMESGTIEVKCECSITRFKSKQFCQNQNGWQVCKYTCRSLYSLLLAEEKERYINERVGVLSLEGKAEGTSDVVLHDL